MQFLGVFIVQAVFLIDKKVSLRVLTFIDYSICTSFKALYILKLHNNHLLVKKELMGWSVAKHLQS